MTTILAGHGFPARGLFCGVSSGPSDRDLVLLLRRRHPGAFDEIFRRYKDRIWRFLVRLTGSEPAAEDLFQDTWLAAARNAHLLREEAVRKRLSRARAELARASGFDSEEKSTS